MDITDQACHINSDLFEDLTGDIQTVKSEGAQEIGTRIRSIRKEKNLSLDDLSKLTGFGVEFLKKIENNEIEPQIGTLLKLSKALESAFGRIISDVGDKLYSITRRDERKIVSRSSLQKGKQKAYVYKSLAPEVKGRHMEALMVQLEENPDQELSVHNGEEFIFVLDGVVSLKIGEEQFRLEPGDSVYYLSTTPHLIAAEKEKATILAVLYC